VVNLQYAKDLSFEVTGAPQVFTNLRAQPEVNINLDVQARRIQDGQNVFEVAIIIRAEGREATAQPANCQQTAAPATLFVAELTYAGVFTLSGLPENAVEPALLVECPRLLFPFARNIIADLTRDGGFPQVALQPIDFVALWQARRAQAQAAPTATGANPSLDPASEPPPYVGLTTVLSVLAAARSPTAATPPALNPAGLINRE
jgi:preprotein translocase subunit SecB